MIDMFRVSIRVRIYLSKCVTHSFFQFDLKKKLRVYIKIPSFGHIKIPIPVTSVSETNDLQFQHSFAFDSIFQQLFNG